jgi:hypothetical protein
MKRCLTKFRMPAVRAAPAAALAGVVLMMGAMIAAAVPLTGTRIVAMLPAMELPAYRDDMIRAQVVNGLSSAMAYQQAVLHALPGRARGFQALNNDAVRLFETVSNPYVESIKVVDGTVVITYGHGADADLFGRTLMLSPGVVNNREVVWVCGLAGVPAGVKKVIPDYKKYTTVPDKWLPESCRAEDDGP